MKDVQVTMEARKRVPQKELSKSIKEAAKVDKPVGFIGTLKTGLKFMVERGKVLLF